MSEEGYFREHRQSIWENQDQLTSLKNRRREKLYNHHKTTGNKKQEHKGSLNLEEDWLQNEGSQGMCFQSQAVGMGQAGLKE